MLPARFRTVAFVVLLPLGFVEVASLYYNPPTGPFLNRDPIGEMRAALVRKAVSASTASFIPRDKTVDQTNHYRYVRNSRANLLDPLGLRTSQPASQPWCGDNVPPPET